MPSKFALLAVLVVLTCLSQSAGALKCMVGYYPESPVMSHNSTDCPADSKCLKVDVNGSAPAHVLACFSAANCTYVVSDRSNCSIVAVADPKTTLPKNSTCTASCCDTDMCNHVMTDSSKSMTPTSTASTTSSTPRTTESTTSTTNAGTIPISAVRHALVLAALQTAAWLMF